MKHLKTVSSIISSALSSRSTKQHIYYKVTTNDDFSRFRWDSYHSGLYPYNSDSIYTAYLDVAQNTHLLPGDYLEIKWELNELTEAWMMFMLLKGYDLTVR